MSMQNAEKPHLHRAGWALALLEPIGFGVVIGLYLWVAQAPFGFLRPDDQRWLLLWRLPPVSQLLISLGLSIAGMFVFLAALVAVRFKSLGSPNGEAKRVFRRIFSPVYFLLISVVQLIPGSLGILPVLPLLSKLILPVAVFSSVLFLFVMETGLVSPTFFRRLDLSFSSHRLRWTLVVFLVSILGYGVFMKRFNTAFTYTGGDEAHYLIQAQSLAEDFDRDLMNQLPAYTHTTEYYRDQHLSPNSRPGRAYSYHSVGLPVLLAPGWAVGTIKGALGVLLMLSSIFATTFFWIAFRLRPRSQLAIGCWAIFCFTTPIIFYACRAYPELPSALIILLAVWKMSKPGALTRWQWLALGCLIAFLPWLHIPRLAIPTLLLSVWGIVWLLFRGKRKNLAFFVPLLFFSVILLVVLNQYWYGFTWDQSPGGTGFERLDPQAWTGGYSGRRGQFVSCLPGLFGSIVDRYKGLLVCSPVYFIPLGCALFGLLSRKLRLWRELWFWVFLSIYIPVLGSSGWYGGACFPSRFLISILPLLVFPFASVLGERTERPIRAMLAVLAAFSVWITVRMFINPAHFYRGAENARWLSPATQLIALFYPYAGAFRDTYRIEDPFGVLLFVIWAGGALAFLQWARKKEIPWRRCFHLAIAIILALPLFPTAVRRIFDLQPYKLLFEGEQDHYATLMGINRPYSTTLRTASWGEVSPETVQKELTLELLAAGEQSKTGEVQKDETLGQEVLTYDPAKHPPGYLSYTRRLKIAPGHYIARFWFAAEGWNPENSVVLEVQDMKSLRAVATRRLLESDLLKSGQFAPVSLPFCVSRWSYLRLMVHVDSKTALRVSKLSVEPGCLRELLRALGGGEKRLGSGGRGAGCSR